MAASKKATVAAEPIIMYTSEIEKKKHIIKYTNRRNGSNI
jgi:hypothetical protein